MTRSCPAGVITGLLFFALLLAERVVACSGADEAALAWLDKMSRSVTQVSYEGVVAMQRGADLKIMHVSHLVHDGRSDERLTQLSGQGFQVRREGHPLECVHPGRALLRIGADMRAGNCGIAEQYRFSVEDGERIAGRKSVQIRVQPRDMYRYGYIMSLDRDTGLLLGTDTVGHGNRLLERFQFANLSYAEATEGTTELDVVHVAEHPHEPPQHSPPGLVRAWDVTWVPQGFTPTDDSTGVSGRRTFTDGLAVFSVFLEDDVAIRPGEGLVREGGTTSYTRGMKLGDRLVLVTVIGEVPVNTARMVADSISWVP